jgi:hypothetical protein
MKPVINEIDALLKAADEWMTAQEALVGAQQHCEEIEAQQEGVDIAGAKLVAAVKRWRSRAVPLANEDTRPQLRQIRAGAY